MHRIAIYLPKTAEEPKYSSDYFDAGRIVTSMGLGLWPCQPHTAHLLAQKAAKDFSVAAIINAASTDSTFLARLQAHHPTAAVVHGSNGKPLIQLEELRPTLELLPNFSRLPQHLAKCLDWAYRHIEGNLSIHDMAAKANLSQRTLEREFQNKLHMSPRTALKELRMKEARRLLIETDLPIADVAVLIGLDPHYFTDAFTKNNGLAPSTYRKNGEIEKK